MVFDTFRKGRLPLVSKLDTKLPARGASDERSDLRGVEADAEGEGRHLSRACRTHGRFRTDSEAYLPRAQLQARPADGDLRRRRCRAGKRARFDEPGTGAGQPHRTRDRAQARRPAGAAVRLRHAVGKVHARRHHAFARPERGLDVPLSARPGGARPSRSRPGSDGKSAGRDADPVEFRRAAQAAVRNDQQELHRLGDHPYRQGGDLRQFLEADAAGDGGDGAARGAGAGRPRQAARPSRPAHHARRRAGRLQMDVCLWRDAISGDHADRTASARW